MIPLMDVARQYAGIQERLDRAVLRVLHSGNYIMGEEVREFEDMFAHYVGARYAVGVGNGTDALVIALRAAGVRAGDEVITTAMSFFATAEAIASVGAVPVFVDCTLDTYTIDAEKMEERITERTKAVVPVHLYGQCAEMDKINRIAKRHGLAVIEDAAQAAGAEFRGRKAGCLGDIACFSFFPTKNLGCAGDGGIITTDDEAIYRKCLAYRVHGSGEDGRFAYAKESGRVIPEGEEGFGGASPKYFNFLCGYNSRLDAVQAAILREKLPFLEGWNEARRGYAAQYDRHITNPVLRKPACRPGSRHVYYVYVLLVEEREAFQRHMLDYGIATGVYFPVPLHLQKALEGLGYADGDMPNAEYLAKHGVAIPMFAELTEEERVRVIDAANRFGS